MTSVEAPSRDRRRPPPWIRRAIITWWLTGLVLVLVVLLVRELQSLLTQIVMALFLSFAIEPVVDKLERRGVRRSLASVLTLLGVVAAIIVFLAMMGTPIADQLNQLVDELPAYVESAQEWLDSTVGIQVPTPCSAAARRRGIQVREQPCRRSPRLRLDIANVLFQVLTVTPPTTRPTARSARASARSSHPLVSTRSFGSGSWPSPRPVATSALA
ncbi:MAG: AI-2E family transporter [Acidimicrobiales bacterium]